MLTIVMRKFHRKPYKKWFNVPVVYKALFGAKKMKMQYAFNMLAHQYQLYQPYNPKAPFLLFYSRWENHISFRLATYAQFTLYNGRNGWRLATPVPIPSQADIELMKEMFVPLYEILSNPYTYTGPANCDCAQNALAMSLLAQYVEFPEVS